MWKGIRPLLRGSTYAGALFALLGAFASLALLPLALLPALVWASAPDGVRVALTLLVWAALTGAVGLARTTRRGLIAAARPLLKVALPAPTPAADRRRTPLWLLLHVALGWAVALVGGLLVVMGVTLPGAGSAPSWS
ncbi:hypothetical protein [Streptomyces sp. G45]|uniref:hypothetical protein n=1 Tax=Streptomyces sp. G45 TaxID=3406627 RepID=UPI003C132367